MAPAFLKRWPNAHVTFVDSVASMLEIPDTRLQSNYQLILEAAADFGLNDRVAGVRSVTCEHDPEFYYEVTVYARVLEGDNPVADFTSSTGLRPFMKALGEPSPEAMQFEQKYRELIAAAYPK
ncbi:hypothetical protein PC114_g18264 [Phytophthora cactorum]|uniref:Uncharacterized protein n=1 Tax=Phytophthora cactorum TaxID=29920 RepID=A0A8T1BIM2_9STRA|nr:hypothetical protein PC114_g18264 [Phytophthora cactorum]KAG2900916.1 hypothetical protein PC115_g16035 [Phytophthora cactorum]KAG3019633.1 hypothetical protein PC120_g9780 [Phytophthora cactorum]KAG3071026.1 hypothetical protein PC121_g9360 [Phytophthora cactorum]KAG3076600.1 hypothetical protein PC122_g13510 [Phytophthora cactorum]